MYKIRYFQGSWGVDGYENGKSEISGKRRGSGTAEMDKISAEKGAEAIYRKAKTLLHQDGKRGADSDPADDSGKQHDGRLAEKWREITGTAEKGGCGDHHSVSGRRIAEGYSSFG